MKRIPNKENSVYQGWRVVWVLGVCAALLGVLIGFFSLNTGYEGLTPPAIMAIIGMVAIPAVPLYTLPAYFAYRKGLASKKKYLWANLLLGWTVVGYILCAVRCGKAKNT